MFEGRIESSAETLGSRFIAIHGGMRGAIFINVYEMFRSSLILN